jgi:hypothetical protein
MCSCIDAHEAICAKRDALATLGYVCVARCY